MRLSLVEQKYYQPADPVFFEDHDDDAITRFDNAVIRVRSRRTSFQNFIRAICASEIDGYSYEDIYTMEGLSSPAQLSTTSLDDCSSDTTSINLPQCDIDDSAPVNSSAVASDSDDVPGGYTVPADADNLESIRNEVLVETAMATEAVTDASLSALASPSVEVTAPADDLVAPPETLAPSGEYKADASVPSVGFECLMPASETPSDVEYGTSCSVGSAFVTGSSNEHTVPYFSEPEKEPDPSLRDIHEDKERPYTVSTKPAPASDLPEEHKLEDVQNNERMVNGLAPVSESSSELTVEVFNYSAPIDELDSSNQDVHEEKEQLDLSAADAGPASNAVEESQLKDTAQDSEMLSEDETFVYEGSSGHGFQVEEKSEPTGGASELFEITIELAPDDAQELSISQATISDAVGYEKLAKFDDNEASVELEANDIATEEDFPTQTAELNSLIKSTITVVEPTMAAEASCEPSSSATALLDQAQARPVENDSEPSERAYIPTTNPKTIKRKALAYRNRFRELPFAVDKDETDKDEEKYVFAASSEEREAPEPSASDSATQDEQDKKASTVHSQQRTPEEYAAYLEEAKQFALKYFWREKFVFDTRWVASVRPKLNLREKKILNSLQRVREGRAWNDEERNSLRSSVYAVFVDELGYVVTDNPELRRNSLEPKRKEGEDERGGKERIGRGSRRCRGKKGAQTQGQVHA